MAGYNLFFLLNGSSTIYDKIQVTHLISE